MPRGSKKKSDLSFGLFKPYHYSFSFGIVLGVISTLLVQQAFANNLNPKNNSNTFLAGTVYSSAGGTISRAKVSLAYANQTFTDSLGRYVLAHPNSSGCTGVYYSAKGYQEQKYSICFVNGTTIYQDVTLQKIN